MTRGTARAADRETSHNKPYNKSKMAAPIVTPTERSHIGVSQIDKLPSRIGGMGLISDDKDLAMTKMKMNVAKRAEVKKAI